MAVDRKALIRVGSTELTRQRGAVVERFVNIETMMNFIISQHYLGRVDLGFIFQVLYDDQCTFALKRNVLFKVLGKAESKGLYERLCRLNSIRNCFAHRDFRMLAGEGAYVVPDPKQPERQIDFNALYGEFMGTIGEVENKLGEIMGKKGIKVG